MKKKNWLIRNIVPILTILFVIAISVGIHLYFGRHPERLIELKNQAYWGTFVISLLGNATVILPGAVLPIISSIGTVIYAVTGPMGPVVVGLVGGLGAAIGETTGYLAGYSGRGIVEKVKLYDRLVGWLKRWGVFAIFVLSVVPFFFDLAGIAAGALRFPYWKFFLACWLGRTVLYVVAVLLVALGVTRLLPVFV